MNKVNEGDEMDNCKLEFNYSLDTKTPSKMIVVVMEPSMRDIVGKWKGDLRMCLGTRLYIDMSGDVHNPEYLAGCLPILLQQLELTGIKPSGIQL